MSKKRILALLLVILLAFSLAACTAAPVAESYEGMDPVEAAEAAAAATPDKASFSDIIRVPFGYLLDWLHSFCKNYGVALILFSLIVKLVLLPMGIKSKKSMLKMSRMSPLVKSLEAKYGDDKQKYQQEVMKLYQEEHVSTTGGCLWSFIPLLILLPLYYVIREPLTYMLHNSRSVSAAITAYIQASGADLGSNAYYAQLAAAGHLGEYIEELKNVAVTANANLAALNFSFCGVNLAAIPSFAFWKMRSWSEIGLFLLPVLSAGSQVITMLISQKMNGAVATNADGEKDAEAAKSAKQTNLVMMLMMPLMSLWIGFAMPAALSLYWLAQGIFSTVQDVILTKRYTKIYDKEDAERQARAAERRAEEAEKERQRQLRREQNPDGITDNVSKKKLKQQEKQAAEEAARAYAAKINPAAQEAEDEDRPLSGDPERPYCRGRAYQPNRYHKGGSAQESEE